MVKTVFALRRSPNKLRETHAGGQRIHAKFTQVLPRQKVTQVQEYEFIFFEICHKHLYVLFLIFPYISTLGLIAVKGKRYMFV